MPDIEFVTHVAAEVDPATSLIGDLVILDPGGGAAPILVSTTLYDGGIEAWDLSGPTPVAVDSAAYSGEAGLGGVPVLAVVDTGSGLALLAASGACGALMLYPVLEDGTLGVPENLGQTIYGADLSVAITVVLPGGDQVVYAGLAGQPGIARITFDAEGRLVSESFTADTTASAATDIAGLAHIRAGGADWLISACGTENAVTLWSIAASGGLSVAETLTGEEGLWVSAPSALMAAEAHGAAYAILASAGTDSLTVMRVEGDGTLRITDHLIDDLGTRFGGVAALEVVEVGARIYVIAGGADNGISLDELMPNGRLLARAHIEDTTEMGLANVSAIAATAVDGRVDIFVSSAAEPGLTQLSYTPPPAGETLFAPASGGSLAGGSHADILTGAQGTDTLSGGGGEDVILDGGGQDVLTGSDGDDALYGEGGDDLLYGMGGNDLLDGGPGRDQMEGGAGHDIYHVEDDLDFVLGETASGGTDTVLSWISYTLPGNIEFLRLQGSEDIHATGTSGADNLVGQSGDNILTGLAGFDILTAKAGADRLIGGPGRDWLVGDAGPDVFVYGSADDSRPDEANRDFINGFENGVDLIDLSSLDGNGRQSGNQAFIWIGTEPFSASGQLRWHTWGDNNYGIVEADQDGDGEAEFQIFINLTDHMTANDFIL